VSCASACHALTVRAGGSAAPMCMCLSAAAAAAAAVCSLARCITGLHVRRSRVYSDLDGARKDYRFGHLRMNPFVSSVTCTLASAACAAPCCSLL
jgi:hypothetical protein